MHSLEFIGLRVRETIFIFRANLAIEKAGKIVCPYGQLKKT